MTMPLRPGSPAADHLLVVVEPSRRTRRTRALSWLISLIAAALVSETGGPSVQDVVVRRRPTGEEVLRIDVADGPEADRLVERLREDLAAMTVAEFGVAWNVPRAT